MPKLVYVSADGFSHWHILRDGQLELTRCGFGVPVTLPGRVAGVSWRMSWGTKPFCENCVANQVQTVDVDEAAGANVLDSDAFKAGARFERRQLAIRLRAIATAAGEHGWDRPVLELANELDPQDT